MLMNLENLKSKYNCDFKGVYHIGGHIGQEALIYKNLGIKPIVFFEPLKFNYNRLTKHCIDNNVIAYTYNCAISPIEGEIEMFVESANDGQSSSCLRPDLHLLQYPNIQFNTKIKVKTDKLDNYYWHGCNFINIDVQGYELEALKTGPKVLSNVDYLMAEVNRFSLYRNCALVEELDEYLLTFGLERVETDWAGQTWGDAFYVKKNRI